MRLGNEYSRQNINTLGFIPETEKWFNSHELIATNQDIKSKRKDISFLQFTVLEK